MTAPELARGGGTVAVIREGVLRLLCVPTTAEWISSRSKPHVLPLAVEEVAGDDDEVDRLVDGALHQVVERCACGASDVRFGYP